MRFGEEPVKSHCDKVVLWGMSCVGKTTFGQQMNDHRYLCFDALFDWYSIETLGLSTSTSLAGIADIMSKEEKIVLDGWHLGDIEGAYLPGDSTVYVLYADYERVINQYRIDVRHPEEHRHMFKRWYYEVPYERFPRVRYWENLGEFTEREAEEFQDFLEANR